MIGSADPDGASRLVRLFLACERDCAEKDLGSRELTGHAVSGKFMGQRPAVFAVPSQMSGIVQLCRYAVEKAPRRTSCSLSPADVLGAGD